MAVVRVALYFGNVAALGALGVKTVKLWTDKAFDLLETMKAFPAEAEFADLSAAERQVWRGIGFETFVFVIGGFLCYEFFIKPKSIRLRLIAPFVTAFLVLTGESVNLFLPALDKVHEIETCQMQGIPWSSRRHECDYMELERRRMERMRAAKKPVKVRKKPSRTSLQLCRPRRLFPRPPSKRPRRNKSNPPRRSLKPNPNPNPNRSPKSNLSNRKRQPTGKKQRPPQNRSRNRNAIPSKQPRRKRPSPNPPPPLNRRPTNPQKSLRRRKALPPDNKR